jgi:hypothetical protein
MEMENKSTVGHGPVFCACSRFGRSSAQFIFQTSALNQDSTAHSETSTPQTPHNPNNEADCWLAFTNLLPGIQVLPDQGHFDLPITCAIVVGGAASSKSTAWT